MAAVPAESGRNTDEVDFETAVGDPAAYYADPQAVVADNQLGIDQKRRFLTERPQDIADLQTAAAEGMGPDGPMAADRDAGLLQQLEACLSQLDSAAEMAADRPEKVWWRRWKTS